MCTLTEQRTYEDENLDGGGEVPVDLLPDEPLLLVQPGPFGRWAAVPRPGGRVLEIQPDVGCCEIDRTVRRCPAPAIHVESDPGGFLRALAGCQQPAVERHS